MVPKFEQLDQYINTQDILLSKRRQTSQPYDLIKPRALLLLPSDLQAELSHMASLVTAAVLLILSRSANHVLAHPSASSASTSRICADIIIPVTVANATNSVFQVPHVNNDIDAVTLALDIDRWSAPNITQRTIRNFDIVNETFDISAQLCTPKVKVGDKAQTLQIATHGFHFDKR